MPHSPERSIRAFASQRRLRVRTCIHFYFGPVDPTLFEVNLRFRHRRFSLSASRRRIVLTGKGEVPVFFSVGSINPMLVTGSAVDTGDDVVGYVYAREGFEAKVEAWIKRKDRLAQLRGLGLRSGESLHVARNETMLISWPDRDIERVFEAFVAFLEAISEAKSGVGHTKGRLLPSGFEDLEPIARKWAVSDDVERSDAWERAGGKVRAKLKAMLVPRLKDIDEYLDSLGAEGPLAEKDCRLQTLGELGAELAVKTWKG